MTDYLPGYDAWLSREPEYAEEPLPEEDEIEEPTVAEVWDGGRGEYITEVTFASGKKFGIQIARSGAYVGDYEIVGAEHPKHRGVGFYADGYPSEQHALTYLTDIEHWGW